MILNHIIAEHHTRPPPPPPAPGPWHPAKRLDRPNPTAPHIPTAPAPGRPNFMTGPNSPATTPWTRAKQLPKNNCREQLPQTIVSTNCHQRFVETIAQSSCHNNGCTISHDPKQLFHTILTHTIGEQHSFAIVLQLVETIVLGQIIAKQLFQTIAKRM